MQRKEIFDSNKEQKTEKEKKKDIQSILIVERNANHYQTNRI